MVCYSRTHVVFAVVVMLFGFKVFFVVLQHGQSSRSIVIDALKKNPIVVSKTIACIIRSLHTYYTVNMHVRIHAL